MRKTIQHTHIRKLHICVVYGKSNAFFDHINTHIHHLSYTTRFLYTQYKYNQTKKNKKKRRRININEKPKNSGWAERVAKSKKKNCKQEENEEKTEHRSNGKKIV